MSTCVDEINEYYKNLAELFTDRVKEVKVLFVEDYLEDVSDLDQINQQFFRILKALGLKTNDYGFVSSSMFQDLWYTFSNLVVLGENSLSRLKSSERFIKLEQTNKNSIVCIPSSSEMMNDRIKKKEGWEKLKRIKLR